MRCSRCDMPLSPTKTSCPRCDTIVTTGDRRQGILASAFAQASFASSAGFAGTAVEVAPLQHNWELQARQEMPPMIAPTPLQTPLLPEVEQAQISTHRPTTSAPAPSSALPKTKSRSTTIGFGLAGLCVGIACLLLVFVSVIAQNLPQGSTVSPPRVGSKAVLLAQNTPGIHASPTTTITTASTSATYPGQQYIANAQTAIAIDFTNTQPTLPTNTFRVGQKIYITFDVRPNGHVGAICLLWYLNATQFANYPFSINTTTTTAAYSYAATSTPGQGYVEIYWENAPSCTDPNKILGDSVPFTILA